MTTIKKAMAAAVLAATAGIANAGQIALESGYGTTFNFDALGATDLYVTSVYQNNGSAVDGSESTTLAGTLLFNDVGSGTIDNLDPLIDAEDATYGTNWLLDFSYSIGGAATFLDGGVTAALSGGTIVGDGTLDGNGDGEIDENVTGFTPGAPSVINGGDAILPTITYGVFEFFYNDLNDDSNDTKVLELSLTGASGGLGNLVIEAVVNWDWYALVPQSDFIENFFVDVDSGLSFFEVDPYPVSMRVDTNVDPNLLPTCDDAQCATLSRTTNLNLSATFDVPEPGTLALFGLGLLGLGAASRRKAA